MKKFFAFMFLALVFTSFANAQQWVNFSNSNSGAPAMNLITSNVRTVTFEVAIPGIYRLDTLVNSTAFSRLFLPNGAAVNPEGSPEIPVLTYRVAVPKCAGINVAYHAVSQQSMTPCLLYPVPHVIFDTITGAQVEQFVFDPIAYTQPRLNEPMAIITDDGMLREQNYVEVMVKPVEYCPVTQQLSVIDKVTITLTFANPQGDIQQNVGLFNKVAAAAFINYQDNGVSAKTRGNPISGNVKYVALTDTAQACQIDADYLIITVPEFFNPFDLNSQLRRLAEHRVCYNGFSVAIVNVENIVSDALGFYYEEQDKPYPNYNYKREQRLRTFIKRVYEGKKAPNGLDGHVSFVLLVGDNYAGNMGMPTATEHGSIQYQLEGVCPSDYYFSCVTKKANGKYDDIGDLFIGRFSVEDEPQLSNMVEKTIFHETAYDPNPWRKTAGTTNWGLTHDYAPRYINFMTNLFNSCGLNYTIVDKNQLNGAIKIPTLNYLNAGALFVQHIGTPGNTNVPLSPDTWEDGLNISYFSNELHNDYMAPFISVLSNTSGHFDDTECLAEFLTRYDSIKGAVGCIAPSRRTSLPVESWPSGSQNLTYQEFLSDFLFNQGICIAGELLWTTKVSNTGSSQLYFKHAYNLLGDPALNILANVTEDIDEITQNVTFDSPSSLANTLYVRNGGTLTITSTLNCYENASIIVEPGGKVIVNGGILTAAQNGKMWKGIVVLGDPTKQQTSEYQGTIELKSGAAIEHALCAIDVASPGNYVNPCGGPIGNGNFGGGIIRADSATFYNNLRSVNYYPYETPSMMGVFIDNVGRFTNCTFTDDSSNCFEYTNDNYHVKLWGVRNVTFEGCLFEDNNSSYSQHGGVYSLDAGVKVKNYCSLKKVSPYIDCACPSAYTTPTIFRKLIMGINSENTESWHQIYIDQSKFDTIPIAVQISNQNNYRVTRCDINYSLGLHSFNSSGYRIEENNFYGNTYFNGIYVKNSGIADNQIYKNNFMNLNYGIFISGINGTNDFKPPHGLQLKCNNFTSNDKDIWGDFGSILPSQGSPSAGADNTFVGTINNTFFWFGSHALSYYHSPGNNHVPYNPIGNVTVYNNAAPCECASTFCLPIGGKALAGADSLEQYKMFQEQYDKLFAQLEKNPELLSELLIISDAMRELSDHAISRILGDSILYIETLKRWYEVVRTPVAKYCLAEGYFNERNYEQSEAILREIPSMFAFNESELMEHENYMRFHHFKKQMYLSGKNWDKLDEAEVAYLQTIAEATNGRSSSMANGVLCFFYNICEEFKIEYGEGFPPKNAATETQTTDTQNKDTNYELSIYPNPTQSEIAVVTNNPAVKIVQTEIYDFTNRRVHQQTVNQSYGTLRLNDLAQGVYVLKVWLDNGDMVVRKVVKQ